MARRGIVLNKTGTECIVLTPEGEFCRSICGPETQPGNEIEVSEPRRLWRYLLLVASLAVAFLGWQMYRFTVPPVAAYVSLDINPSLELGVDNAAVVVKVIPLDREGNRLVESCTLKGIPLDQALKRLIAGAVRYRYLAPGREATILVAVTPTRTSELPVTPGSLASIIAGEVREQKAAAKVVAFSGTPDERKKARREGVSAGRYRIQVQAKARGKEVTPKALQAESLAELEARTLPLEKLLEDDHSLMVVEPGDKPGTYPGYKEGPATRPPLPQGRKHGQAGSVPKEPEKSKQFDGKPEGPQGPKETQIIAPPGNNEETGKEYIPGRRDKGVTGIFPVYGNDINEDGDSLKGRWRNGNDSH